MTEITESKVNALLKNGTMIAIPCDNKKAAKECYDNIVKAMTNEKFHTITSDNGASYICVNDISYMTYYEDTIK